MFQNNFQSMNQQYNPTEYKSQDKLEKETVCCKSAITSEGHGF